MLCGDRDLKMSLKQEETISGQQLSKSSRVMFLRVNVGSTFDGLGWCPPS